MVFVVQVCMVVHGVGTSGVRHHVHHVGRTHDTWCTRCTYMVQGIPTCYGVLPIALSALQFDIHDIVASPDSITGEAIQLCGSK